MDNITHDTPQQTPRNGNGFAVASITLGIISFATMCVPWLMLVLALTGTTFGIISWVKATRTSTPPTLPIIGTIASGVATIVALIITTTFYLALDSINAQWGEEFSRMDSMFNSMRDSIDIWDNQFDYDQLPEADSTFFIK